MELWDRKHARLWSTTSQFVSEGLSDEDNPGKAKRVKLSRPRYQKIRSLKFKLGARYAKNRRYAGYKGRHNHFR